MKAFWLIVAAIGGATAVFFVIRDDFDKAFVAAAVGAVAWFLNYRARLRETLKETDETDQDQE